MLRNIACFLLDGLHTYQLHLTAIANCCDVHKRAFISLPLLSCLLRLPSLPRLSARTHTHTCTTADIHAHTYTLARTHTHKLALAHTFHITMHTISISWLFCSFCCRSRLFKSSSRSNFFSKKCRLATFVASIAVKKTPKSWFYNFVRFNVDV